MKINYLICFLIALVGQTLIVKLLFGYWIPDGFGIIIRIVICLLMVPPFYKLLNCKLWPTRDSEK